MLSVPPSSRAYNQRYKACQTCLKLPVVAVKGKEVRFCQQCSCFHDITAFDGKKRSCRKKLEEHNRKRWNKKKPEEAEEKVTFVRIYLVQSFLPRAPETTMKPQVRRSVAKTQLAGCMRLDPLLRFCCEGPLHCSQNLWNKAPCVFPCAV